MAKIQKRRLTIEVETVKLFDAIAKSDGLTGIIGERLVGAMLADTGFGEKIALAVYGIEITKEETFHEWSGSPDPTDPDHFWIDDETGERVNALTGERTKP